MLSRRRSDGPAAALALLVLCVVGAILWIRPHDAEPAPWTKPAESVEDDDAETRPSAADAAAERAAIERTNSPRSGSGLEVHGLVVNESGLPVEDALVTLNGPGTADYETRSDATGRFVLGGVVPGRYQVVAVGSHLLSYNGFIEFVGGDDPVDFELRVDQGQPLVGRVFDQDEHPIEGARVTPLRRGPTSDEYDRRCTVTTDLGGNFTLRGRGSGPTFVLVEHENFTSTISRLQPTHAGVVQLRRAK